MRQDKFARGVHKGMNPTKAVLAAGYSETGAAVTANRLLKNPKVVRFLNYLGSRRNKKVDLTPEYVISRLQTIVDRCMEGKEIHDKNGALTGRWRMDTTGANKALELLGKHLVLFSDRVVNVDQESVDRYIAHVATVLVEMIEDEDLLDRVLARIQQDATPENVTG